MHQDERNAKRKNNKDYTEIYKKEDKLRSIIRMDHLIRIPNQ